MEIKRKIQRIRDDRVKLVERIEIETNRSDRDKLLKSLVASHGMERELLQQAYEIRTPMQCAGAIAYGLGMSYPQEGGE